MLYPHYVRHHHERLQTLRRHQQRRMSQNQMFMALVRDKEEEVMALHAKKILPLRPGSVRPTPMPMWRGYSVLEKVDHTARGGTVQPKHEHSADPALELMPNAMAIHSDVLHDVGAKQNFSQQAVTAKTAGGYGTKTIKQEITLIPEHIRGGSRVGTSSSLGSSSGCESSKVEDTCMHACMHA